MASAFDKSGTPLLRKSSRSPSPRGRLRTPSPGPSTPNTDAAPAPDDEPPRRPPLSRVSSRRSRMSRLRSVSPSTAPPHNTRTKYLYAAPVLALSLVTFVIQTELSAYIQDDLGWNKAYCMMYFTHGSWVVLYPALVLATRLARWRTPWSVVRERQVQLLRSTAHAVRTQRVDASTTASGVLARHGRREADATTLLRHMAGVTTFITLSLTVAGLSWYIAVDMTTPSDLTAIYNCNAFFAYAFSVPILGERLRLDKSLAVLIAIAGVLVVVYGSPAEDEKTPGAGQRFLGNVVIGVGSVLYGLYEVLYKRYACPPEGVSPHRSMVFAMAFASCIGAFTLSVLWIPLPLLHVTGLEEFRLPTGRAAWLTVCSVLSNAVFSGSFLVLISLTSPVLSGVAALLTIFLVAIVDWVVKQKALSFAAVVGGAMIIVAFVMLCWSSYREMAEHEREEPPVEFSDSADEESELGRDEDAA